MKGISKLLLYIGTFLSAGSLFFVSMQIAKTDFALSDFFAAPFLLYALGVILFLGHYLNIEKEMYEILKENRELKKQIKN